MRAILAAAAVLLLVGFASAFDIMKLREIDAAAVSDYPDIAQMKEETLLLYYYDENESAEFGDFAGIVYDYAGEFVSQYKTYDGGGAPEFGRLRALLTGLESVDWGLPLSGSIVKHAADSFSEFVNDAADREAGSAERDESTRIRILRYGRAATYYEAAGNDAEAALVSGKQAELERAYNEDMTRAGELADEGRAFFDSALGAGNSLFGAQAYADLMRAGADYRAAMALYLRHGEGEMAGEAGQGNAAAAEFAGKLAGGAMAFAALFAILVFAVAIRIARLAMAWWGDEYDEGLGDEMI
ncbi:MAG: hypothetical protein NT157_04020 [Candidatus Micrarchaeota archaeon]|nr:hypothetical protein [Candidatus Micrarchaeota archaeon]